MGRRDERRHLQRRGRLLEPVELEQEPVQLVEQQPVVELRLVLHGQQQQVVEVTGRLRWLAAGALLLAEQAQAQSILQAQYDPRRDAIVADIAYRGTTPGHRFRAVWGACDRSSSDVAEVSGRLIDEQGAEPAEKNFRVRRRFSVVHIECRPAQVTLRLGRRSIATVDLPPKTRGK